MSDNLRARIAAVFLDWCCKFEEMTDMDRNDMADAVILELGLTRDEEMDVAPDGSPRFYRRYVTEWKMEKR